MSTNSVPRPDGPPCTYLHCERLCEPPDCVLAAAVGGQTVDPDQRRLRRHEHDDALAGLLLDQKIIALSTVGG